MTDTTSGSVSKGVFVFKGKKKVAKPADYFCNGKSTTSDMERMALGMELWDQFNEKIQSMQQELNTCIFEELLQYITDAHRSFSIKEGNHCNKAVAEVPTAALITGVNMPDHAMMFGSLVSEIRDIITPHVAVLRSKDCPNLQTLMAKTLGQLMHNHDIIEDEDEEDQPNMRKISCTMSVLAAWYAEMVKKCVSPRKRKASGSPTKDHLKKYPPIVVVMEDLEAFHPTVLQEFLTICCNNLPRLPLVLVFGIATAVTAVHRLLPSSVSSLLCIEKFQAPPASEYLTQLINKMIMTPSYPFKLGPKTFHLLLDLFLYHDFSIVNFTRNFQLCLLEHFRTHPSSLLCQRLSDAEEQLSNMSSSDLDLIRSLPSFRRYVEHSPPEKQIQLLENDKSTKSCMLKMLHRLERYHQCYFPVLRCLHIFTSRLPGYPLGKQIREMYGTSLSSSMCSTDEYKQAMGLLRSMSRDELVDMLSEACLTLAGEEAPEEINSMALTLHEYEVKFTNIEALTEMHEAEAAASASSEDDRESQEEDEKGKQDPPKKMGMYELRQKLQAMEKKKKKLSFYETLRNEMVDYIDSGFRKYVLPAQSFILHEVMYYNNASDIRSQINGSPRVTIQRALSNPYHYLQHDDLYQDGGGSILPMLPDLCIVYKLHLECSKLINLYDWLQAFVMVVEATEDEENQSKPKEPDATLQARFIRAVSELQFLGFIKPTKRKTDHVARLTWGGC